MGGQPLATQAAGDARNGGPSENQTWDCQQARHHHHGNPRKAKHPASWRHNNKQVKSSLNRDVTEIELWDDKIKDREKDALPEEEDWDALEAQTEGANGLMWDDIIPKDHGVQPNWVEEQERKLMERSLPWRQDPEGTWF